MFPEFIRLGNFVIYWYGIMVALAVLTASVIFHKTASEQGYKPELISQLIFWSVVWGIIGGRLLHVVVQMPYYYRHPFQILSIRNGGLAAEGSVLAAVLFISVYSKIKRFNLSKTLDIIAVPVPLAQAIGRIGCFLNGCCYGKGTESVVGVSFPHLQAPAHPTQLYYTITNLVLFFFLLHLYRKKVKEGMIFSAYIMCFALIRYGVDFLRGDLLATFLGLYPTQIIAIFLFGFGVMWFLSSAQKSSKFEK